MTNNQTINDITNISIYNKKNNLNNDTLTLGHEKIDIFKLHIFCVFA